MDKQFKIGDHVRWNSEVGRLSGVIRKKAIENILWRGYVHHASKGESQYIIQSDKPDQVAIHKGTALQLIASRTGTKAARAKR